MVDDEADLELVLPIFAEGLKAVEGKPGFEDASIGLFTEEESRRFRNVVRVIDAYLALPSPRRPLSIGVFGAPGCGKSRLVKDLVKKLTCAGDLGPRVDINLTQISTVEELATVLDEVARPYSATTKAPFVFFDEFDARLAGASWGWLSWFLAPMQDGLFTRGGKPIPLRRALFVFAGGTASSFEEFISKEHDSFAIAKGPDFASRLRGYIDIPGLNADLRRSHRRAASLHYELNNDSAPRRTISDGLRDALIHVGRYKHGARSLGALIELLPTHRTGRIDDLRDQELRRMHVDRGPLDPEVIGGCVGLSAGGDGIGSEIWKPLLKNLLTDGAKLAYGGVVDRTRLFATDLAEAARLLPQPLESAGRQRLLMSSQTNLPSDALIEIFAAPVVAPDEVSEPLRRPLALFRMRYLLALRSVAQVAMAGRLADFTGRFPGVVEELMLSLALRHPTYIIGACGGGAQWAGILLGLGRQWSGPLPDFDRDTVTITSPQLFRPPPFRNLPVTRDKLVAFFERHAIDGPDWVPNGLSTEDNRTLFASTDPQIIADLVRRGLRARFAEA